MKSTISMLQKMIAKAKKKNNKLGETFEYKYKYLCYTNTKVQIQYLKANNRNIIIKELISLA